MTTTEAPIVFANARVFDATGNDRFEGHVVVVGKRIRDITTGAVPSPRGAQIVDCAGATLMPGLIDAHTHHGAIDANVSEQHRRYHTSYASIAIAQRIEDTLNQGFTTARDAAGIDAGFRQASADGLIKGPRLFVSGRPLSQTGGHGDHRQAAETTMSEGCQVGQLRTIADGVDEVRKATRETLRRGADQIKIMAGGGVLSPTDHIESTQYSVEELRVICEEAAAGRSYCLAHAYTPAAIRNCVQAGVRSIEHGNLLDADTAILMANTGTYLVPTLAVYEFMYQLGDKSGLGPASLEKVAHVYDRGVEAARLAHASGVRIGSGSDLLGPLSRQLAREITVKARALGAVDALISATRTNAELMRIDSETGTIEEGKVADLLVVEGDVVDDPDILEDRARLRVIMHAGRMHKQTLG